LIHDRDREFFSLPSCPHQLWGLPNFLSNAYWRLFPQGVRHLGHESDHSPPSSAKVENTWSWISTPAYIFKAWSLVKYRIFFQGVVLG
jgi:hypothetical protein